MIDEEVAKILHAAADRAQKLLTENRDKLDLLSKELEKQEMLDDAEIERLIGPPASRNYHANGQAVVNESSETPKEKAGPDTTRG
jgi:hypothetical protein